MRLIDRVAICTINLLILAAPLVYAENYFVSSTGSDDDAGSQSDPFRTIQYGVNQLGAGDTLFILGGTYHEEVLIKDCSGLPGADIVISAYPGERVLLDGSIPIESTWELHKENIYKTTIESDIWQLFVDGRMQVVARWPNASTHPVDPISREPGSWAAHDGTWWSRSTTWASADAPGTINGVLENNPAYFDLAGSAKSFEGGTVILSVLEQGGHGNQERLITHHEAGSNILEHPVLYPPKPDKAYRTQGKYYLIEHLEALDQQEEWYFIDSTNTIYLWAKDGKDPNKLAVRGRNLSRAFTLFNSDYLTLIGLDFFACNFSIMGEYVTIEDCHFTYPDASKRLVADYANTSIDALTSFGTYADGASFSLINCEFSYSEYSALKLENGTGSLIHNNLFYHISMLGLGMNGAIEQVNTYTRNSLITSGCRGAVKTNAGPVEGRMHSHNRFDGFGFMQVPDGAALQANVGNTPNANRGYNWFLNAPKYGSRWDGRPAGKGGLNHHSVGVLMRGCLQVKGDEHHNYNNSCFDSPSNNDIILLSDPTFGGNEGSFTFNNLADRMSGHREESLSSYPLPGAHGHNWNGYEQGSDANLQVRDVENRDFRPRPGSDLVDAGQEIPGITDGFQGGAPDIGAYEFGDTLYWIPGRKTDKSSSPVPADKGSTRYQFVDLIWLEGYNSISSDVYFGLSMDAVESATHGSPEYMGNQVSNIFYPGFLQSGQTFYWRIDAVEKDLSVKGEVWSFTPAEDANPQVFQSNFLVSGMKAGVEFPLDSAVILLGDRRAVSDSHGKATFTMLPEGSYTFTVSRNGYLVFTDSLVVPSDTTEVLMEAEEDFLLRLHVVNRNTNGSVYRAFVTYKDLVISTNKEGVAILEHLPYGRMGFGIEHDDYFPYADSVWIRKDTSIELGMTSRLAELRFIIGDGSLSLEGAKVELEGSVSQLSNEQGLVRFLNRPAREKYNYVVSKEGYTALSDSIFLEVDSTVNIVMQTPTGTANASLSTIQFFPNPAKDWVQIHLPYTGTLVRIVNQEGKILLEENLAKGEHTLNISSLKPGVFILETETDTIRARHKLVIH